MSNGSTHIATRAPSPPRYAEFAIYIDFEKGRGSPTRVYRAADLMIHALQNLDKTLCGAIDTQIEPILVSEDLETGSMKIWLMSALKITGDQALKDLNWRPVVGEYLASAKYAYIRWANKGGQSLVDLAHEVEALAERTGFKQIPDYSPPSFKELAGLAFGFDKVKAIMEPMDRIQYIMHSGESVECGIVNHWSPKELLKVNVS